jgi:PPP family 3-phenylpropionic acid transporter
MSLPPLSPEQKVKPRYFELRLAAMFFTLLIPGGIYVPYFPLWLERHGFGPQEIAVILSAPMFLRVATTPVFTALADRARDRANVYNLLVAASAVVSAGYFLKPTYAVVLAVSLLLAAVWTPHSPIADSLALSGVRRFGANYTAMRIWGSISFLLANLVGGFILAATGADAVPVLVFGAFCLTLVVGLAAPRLGPPRLASPLSATGMQEAAPRLLNGYFLYFVLGAGVVIASHSFINSFASIYWRSVGIGDSVIGMLWAFAVVAEVGMFFGFNRLFGKVPVATLILAAAVGAALRWALFPLIWPFGLGVPGFFAVQALHAVSTALVLIGLQKMIGETVADRQTGAAQGIAYFSNYFFTAVATLASGPLYARFGFDGGYAMVPVALAGFVLIRLAVRSTPQAALGR